MLVNLIILLLILTAGALYTAHHVKRFRTIEQKTRYTSALHVTYILAAALMWTFPLLYSIAALNDRMSASIPTLRWLLGVLALILIVISGCLYVLDKRAQRASK